MSLYRAARLVLAVAVWLAIVPPGLARANGGDRVWASELPTGPYLITLTAPRRPSPGTIPLAVHVESAVTGAPVEDARVHLRLQPPDETGSSRTYEAAPSQDTPVHYDAVVDFDTPGTWRVTADAQGEEGAGQASASVQVVEPTTGPVAIGVVASVLFLAILAGLAFRKASNQSRSRGIAT